jgi:uncharacterized protein
MNSGSKTLLYHGLPAVWSNGEWIIFSPYAQQVIRLSPDEVNSPLTKNELDQLSFFSSPSPRGPGEFADYCQVILITTGDCNLECIYCFAFDEEAESRRMDEELAFASIRYGIDESARKQRKLLLSFFGGEPTLVPNLIRDSVDFSRELARHAGLPDPIFSISTNGVVSAETLRLLIGNKFTITVSMDGVPDIQNTHRPLKGGLGSSHIVEKTIRDLAEAGADFFVRATVTSASVCHMPESISYLKALGVDRVHFEAISIAGRATIPTKGNFSGKPTADEFARYLIEAIRLGNDLGVSVMNSSYMNLLQPAAHFCDGIGGNRIAITSDGLMSTCLEVQGGCHPAAGRYVIGEYDKTSKRLVINTAKRKSLCSEIIASAADCVDCFAKYICAGGCPIRNQHATGSPLVVDPFNCKVVKIVLPFVIEMVDRSS